MELRGALELDGLYVFARGTVKKLDLGKIAQMVDGADVLHRSAAVRACRSGAVGSLHC